MISRESAKVIKKKHKNEKLFLLSWDMGNIILFCFLNINQVCVSSRFVIPLLFFFRLSFIYSCFFKKIFNVSSV